MAACHPAFVYPWSWVSWGPESRMTVLASASSNLPDLTQKWWLLVPGPGILVVDREAVENGPFLGLRMLTYCTEFDCEDGCNIYIWKVGDSAHIHMVQRPKSRININNKPLWKPKISKFLLLFIGSETEVFRTNSRKIPCLYPQTKQ
jgi:hypothetical protein